MRICLAQFAKSPEYDAVKTRLRPLLTESQSVLLHKNLVTHVVEQLALATGFEHSIWSTKGGEFIGQLCRRYQLSHYRQEGSDLGERLAFALQQSLHNFDAAALIGSDCPYLDGDILAEVAQALKRRDIVIVPALDGGYVLLAAKVYYPQLFRGIDWGTEVVFAQTLVRVEALGLNYLCLEALPDIDRPEDLNALRANKQLAYLLP